MNPRYDPTLLDELARCYMCAALDMLLKERGTNEHPGVSLRVWMGDPRRSEGKVAAVSA
jgi:hypothetical protein